MSLNTRAAPAGGGPRSSSEAAGRRLRRRKNSGPIESTQAPSALALAPAPQGLPALFERAAQAANFDVEALGRLLALKAEIEAAAEAKAFDRDFADLQAELAPVEANAFDPQKRRAYADLGALVDAVGGLIAAKGFALSYDAAPGALEGTVRITAKLFRAGVERTASVDMPMDGAGMRGGANMSAPQAYASTLTHGRKAALSLLFNLTVSGPNSANWQNKAAEPPPRLEQPNFLEDDPGGSGGLLTALRRAAERSERPPSDKQLDYLASLMGKRGESASAVLEEDGSLSSRAAGAAIADRVGGRS
jgi:hypothetical protein